MSKLTVDEVLETAKAGCLSLRVDPYEMAELLREQKALILEWEGKAANWFASPEAVQQLDGYRELAARACNAEMECARLTAELESAKSELLSLEIYAGTLQVHVDGHFAFPTQNSAEICKQWSQRVKQQIAKESAR